MSTPIALVLLRLFEQLVDDGVLELVPGASVPELVDEVLVVFGQKGGRFSQFGNAVSQALIASPRVVELYETDAELAGRLNHLMLG